MYYYNIIYMYSIRNKLIYTNNYSYSLNYTNFILLFNPAFLNYINKNEVTL